MKQALIDRLSRYVQIDTQSDAASTTTPSTEKQRDLLRLLESEIKALGLEVSVDDRGYLMATLPSNTDKKYRFSVSWHMWIQRQILQVHTLNHR